MWGIGTVSDKIHEIRKQGNIFFLLNAFLGAYNRRTDVLAKASAGNDGPKLDELLERTRPLADFPLLVERVAIIHALLVDDSDPEQIAQLAARVRSIREKLKASLDSQTKEND